MRLRVTVALLVGLTLALFASTATEATANPVVPAEGQYRGKDTEGHDVSFYLFSEGRILSFRVSGVGASTLEDVGPIQVLGDRWHRTCGRNGRTCVRGEWTSADIVVGEMNHGPRHFTFEAKLR